MGFIDPTDKVIDVILTREGRRQLARGRLRFAYFSLFDDEVDYAGTIEDTPVFEPTVGRLIEESSDVDYTGIPASRLFDMPTGQEVLPHLTVSPDIQTALLEVRQVVVSSEGPRELPVGVLRQRPSVLDLVFDVRDHFPDDRDLGVKVRVFASGSDGLREIPPALDFMNEHSYGLHLKVYPDARDSEIVRKVSRAEGDTEI